MISPKAWVCRCIMVRLSPALPPGGPAEKFGLKQGDVILNFDGKDVTQMRSLPRIVAETEIGEDRPNRLLAR